MGRPAGMVDTEPRADGGRAIVARFRHQDQRVYITFGRDTDGWTTARGRSELNDVLAQLKAGIPLQQILDRYRTPPPARHADDVPDGGPTFHEYASDWLARRRTGEIGESPLAERTHTDYRWRLARYLLPFFGDTPVEAISDEDCRRFRARLMSESEQLRELIAAGAQPRDRRGRRRRPLSPSTIKKQMTLLAQILEDAVEDRLLTHNPARSKRLRIRIPKPSRSFLEIDQLAAVIDAAAELEQAPRTLNGRARLTPEQAAEIRARLRAGQTQSALAAEYGLSEASMSLLANGKTYRTERTDRVGWRAFCATLGYAGPRISEALALRERDVRLHDPAQSRLWIADSKTETGVRHVEVTPQLREELLAHREHKARHGYPHGADDPFFCTRTGSPWDAANVRPSIVTAAAVLASERMVARGLPPLPHVTPHTLRRTYVSIMLLATDFDVPFVQRQVGHADSKMTMDVYAQLLDRSKRHHGAAFDALLDTARKGLIDQDLGTRSHQPTTPRQTRDPVAEYEQVRAGGHRRATEPRRSRKRGRMPSR